MGIKSKTNFLYNNEQISKILKANFDFKSSNISKFILELNFSFLYFLFLL